MFRITISILALLTIASGLFAFGAISIPAVSIARALFLGFAFLLAIDLTLGREHRIKTH